MLTNREELLEDLEAMGRPDICEALNRDETASLDDDSKWVLQEAAHEVRRKRKVSTALLREALIEISTSGVRRW